MSELLEAKIKSMTIPLIPMRGTAPVAQKLMGRVYICRTKSKGALQEKKQPLLFCAQKSNSDFVNLNDLYPMGVLGLVRQVREESEGIKVIYESLHRVSVSKIYENEKCYYADVIPIIDEMNSAKVSDHWSAVKGLISLFSQSPIGAKWDFVNFAQQDIADGLEPSFFGESLAWLCGNLLDERIFTVEQRQGLLSQATPNAAIDYVIYQASMKLNSFNDLNVFSKAYEFEKS